MHLSNFTFCPSIKASSDLHHRHYLNLRLSATFDWLTQKLFSRRDKTMVGKKKRNWTRIICVGSVKSEWQSFVKSHWKFMFNENSWIFTMNFLSGEYCDQWRKNWQILFHDALKEHLAGDVPMKHSIAPITNSAEEK